MDDNTTPWPTWPNTNRTEQLLSEILAELKEIKTILKAR